MGRATVVLRRQRGDLVGRATVVLRGLRGDLVAAYCLLMTGSRGAGTDLFCLVSSDRPHGKSMKLHQGRFRLAITKRFFTTRVVGHRNRLPRKVAMGQTLPEFKKRLHNACRNTV